MKHWHDEDHFDGPICANCDDAGELNLIKGKWVCTDCWLSDQMGHFHIDPRYEYHIHAMSTPEKDCWSCIDDRTYDGAGSNMIGWGKTKEEALADLVRLFEERADYWQSVHEAECEKRGCNGF
jgi:hypothetical protein